MLKGTSIPIFISVFHNDARNDIGRLISPLSTIIEMATFPLPPMKSLLFATFIWTHYQGQNLHNLSFHIMKIAHIPFDIQENHLRNFLS